MELKSASWRHYSRNQEMVETAPVRSYYTMETTLKLIMRLGGDHDDTILEMVKFELRLSSYIGDIFGAKICVLETFLETLQPKSRNGGGAPQRSYYVLETTLKAKSASWRRK